MNQLEHCTTCNQMTNHKNGICLKHMDKIQQHIEDSLEKLLEKSTEIYIGSGSDLIINTTHAVYILKQSILEQADILRREVEKLDRYDADSDCDPWSDQSNCIVDRNYAGDYLKRQDVLDLLKINKE